MNQCFFATLVNFFDSSDAPINVLATLSSILIRFIVVVSNASRVRRLPGSCNISRTPSTQFSSLLPFNTSLLVNIFATCSRILTEELDCFSTVAKHWQSAHLRCRTKSQSALLSSQVVSQTSLSFDSSRSHVCCYLHTHPFVSSTFRFMPLAKGEKLFLLLFIPILSLVAPFMPCSFQLRLKRGHFLIGCISLCPQFIDGIISRCNHADELR